MKYNSSKRYVKALWCVLLLFIAAPAVKAQVTVEATIDSLQLLIGEQAKIKLQVSMDANQKLRLPLLRDTLVTGVEILDVAKPDTQLLNNDKRWLISQEYTITSFDSALYYLPPFEVLVNDQALLGVGLGKGRQKFLYLPEEHNDCIFAVICEELGLVGACVIMLVFALLILRGFWIALHARDRFGALLVVGFMTLTGLQTFLNIAVVTGLVPATGISLPFFSYGGTALLCQLAEMGIVLSVSRQMPAPENG